MKHSHKIRLFFNLVEVSLAMGVTAMGVVGAMTILPFAMRTTQQTTRDTYLCDAAEMIFAEIDSVLQKKQEGKSEVPAEVGEIAEKQKIFESYMNNATNLNSELNLNLSTTVFGSNGYTVVHTLPHNPDNFGMLTFYQRSGNASNDWVLGTSYGFQLTRFPQKVSPPFFQVLYRIRITSIAEDTTTKRDYLHKFSTEQTAHPVRTKKTYTSAIPVSVDLNPDEKRLYRRVYLDFSWPATQVLSNRNSRTFVREYYYKFN